MEDNSLLILYSGEAPHRSADAYHHFEENKNFFYLTGLRRENIDVSEECTVCSHDKYWSHRYTLKRGMGRGNLAIIGRPRSVVIIPSAS